MNNEEFYSNITAVLENIENNSGYGAVYHDLNEEKCLKNAKVPAFCALCLDTPTTAPLCRYATRTATMHSISAGEPYFQRCWANLLCVTTALAPKHVCRGGLSIVGLSFEGETLDIEDTLKQRLPHLRKQAMDNFISTISSLREISPMALRGLGTFTLESTFSGGLNSADFFTRQNKKYLQQRQIAEAFADLRQTSEQQPDIAADMYQLVTALSRNDRETCMQFISTYMAKLLLASNWNLPKLKAHLRVLLSIITSQEIIRGTGWTTAVSRELRYMNNLEKAESTEDSCYEAAEMIMEHFNKTTEDGAKQTIVNRTIDWLHVHFHDEITLPTIARSIGSSPSSIVHHLSRLVGKTYKQILTEIRIAEAKKLLATTTLELVDVASRCGFYDQSHFTKAFKKETNMTPGKFRHFLTLPKDEILK